VIKLKYSLGDVKIAKKEVVYDGYFQVEKFDFTYKQFSGQWSGVVSREMFVRGRAVSVLIYDPTADTVLLIEQIRVGSFADENSPWQIELVAGIVESGESDLDVAIREAREEAGVNLNEVSVLSSYYTTPGGCNERVTLCYAETDLSTVGGVHGLDEEDEDIMAHVVSRQDAMQMVSSGIITNVNTIVALQWLQLKMLS